MEAANPSPENSTENNGKYILLNQNVIDNLNIVTNVKFLVSIVAVIIVLASTVIYKYNGIVSNLAIIENNVDNQTKIIGVIEKFVEKDISQVSKDVGAIEGRLRDLELSFAKKK